ncbi:DUF1391 family protein [Escherichia coli]|uniref:DUF1391 family protein n=1 Tax=Escherichia coli TaxID=562 RepID=UPI000BB6BFDE|nr:DUF1391 family protein [Escherichia coli]
MTAGFNFNNYAAGFCSATPALRGNEVNMDTIEYTKSKTFKTENGARRWLERNSGE